MKLADVSIRRPVFALMMSLGLVTLGIVSYGGLGVDLMPKTDSPSISVRVGLPGASAEEVESQITEPVETAVNSISGIDELRTTSNQGNGQAQITFVQGKDIDVAIQDVRDKVAPLVQRFGRDATSPVITKANPDSAPILNLAVSGDRDFRELSELVDKKIKQVLETTDGIAEVQFQGDRQRQIQLLLNADRLSAYGLTVDTVRNAIQRQNIEVPGGSFRSDQGNIALRTMGRLQAVSDFNKVILSQKNGQVVTFGDVGRVADTVADPTSIARVDGRPSVALSIIKQTGTNTVALVENVMARIETIKQTLPGDIQIVVRQDQSVFIKKSIDDIQHHLILGSLLAALVVFFFLRNARSTLISAVSIPVSLIGTFIALKFLGQTLNNMTLLALSLATGIVIDDAIVVLENVFRYIEEKGVSPRQAAAEATEEIGLAVLATTLSLCVIFLPVIFISGQIGQYLLAFGIASVTAILLSMFVAFTLTPAMCATMLKSTDAKGQGHSQSKSKGAYAAIDRTYGYMLAWSLRHRVIMVLIAASVVASSIYIYPLVGQELVPDDDQGQFSVSVNLPQGSTLDKTVEFVGNFEDVLRKLPHVETVFTSLGAGSASYFVGMDPLEQRSVSLPLQLWDLHYKIPGMGTAPDRKPLSQQDLMRQVRNLMRTRFGAARTSVSGGTDLSGASIAATGGNNRGGGGGGVGGSRVNMLIQGPEIEVIQDYIGKLVIALKTIPGVAEVDSNFQTGAPELRIITDRVRAADLGVSIDSLASNVRTLVAGENVSTMKQGDNQYDIQLRLDEQFRNDPDKIGGLLIPSSTQGTVRVSDVAQLKMDTGPNAISRYNRQRQISMFATLDGIPLGEGVTRIKEKINELGLKPGYEVVFSGSARTLATTSSDFTLAVLLACAFIYMVLASQFNSLIHPLTIMTALPLSLPAGLLALKIFGMTLNVYSGIGMLMLFGIVKKNSILQVDYTNTLREQGMERHEAMITANHVRLRPILMTTIAIVAGMLPIAFGRGSGAGSRASMAVTIIGGQVLCLLLTLLITPVVYSYFDDLREFSPSRAFARLRGRPASHSEASGD